MIDKAAKQQRSSEQRKPITDLVNIDKLNVQSSDLSIVKPENELEKEKQDLNKIPIAN